MAKKNQKNMPKKMYGLWMLVLTLFIGELFFYTWCRVQCTEMGYDITRSRNQIQKQTKTAYSFRVELASLRSHKRIINKAETEFGLVIPGPEQIVNLP